MKLPPDTPVMMLTAVEQADSVALRSDDLGLSKELQHPVGEGGGTRAAAREGEDDQVFLVFETSLARLETVPRRRVGLGDRRIDRAGGAAAQQDKERGGEEVESVCGIHRSFRFVVFSSLTTSRRLEFQSHSAGPVQLYDASAIRPWSHAWGRSAIIGRHVGGGRLDADQPARPHLRSPPQAKWSRTARATRDASIPVRPRASWGIGKPRDENRWDRQRPAIRADREVCTAVALRYQALILRPGGEEPVDVVLIDIHGRDVALPVRAEYTAQASGSLRASASAAASGEEKACCACTGVATIPRSRRSATSMFLQQGRNRFIRQLLESETVTR